MSILAWSLMASYNDPLFIITMLVFLAGVVLIARSTREVVSAAEFGTLYGFVYGVAVWGSVGYYFDFASEVKTLFAGAVIFDGLVMCAVLRLIFNRADRERDARSAHA